MPSEAQQIRVRTDEERKALLQGYAMAVNDIAEYGLKFGSDQVRFLYEMEKALDDAH